MNENNDHLQSVIDEKSRKADELQDRLSALLCPHNDHVWEVSDAAMKKNADGTFFYSGVINAHENVTSRLCFKVNLTNVDKTNKTLNVVKYYRIDSNSISQDGRMSIERKYIGRFSPINVGETYTFTIWFKTLTNGTLVNNISLNAHALREVLNTVL